MNRRCSILHIFLLIVLLCTMACTSAQNKQAANNGRPFSLPEIPAVLTSPDERASYLVAHYWDNYDFTDTTLISHPEITEQEFVNFIDLLPRVTMDTAVKAMTNVMDAAMNADSLMFAHFAGMSEDYLYDPNSPFRNEEYYIPVIQYIILSHRVDESNKIRSRYQLEMAMKNRPGDIATDFTYTMRTGKTRKMSDIVAEYTILYFNNPDCHDCKRVKTYMANSPVINDLLGDNSLSQHKRELAILSIYPDADLPLWLQAEYPHKWINGYDAGRIIDKEQLYDLKAIPTLYLLDKDKRVIMKDATIEAIEQYLSNIVM